MHTEGPFAIQNNTKRQNIHYIGADKLQNFRKAVSAQDHYTFLGNCPPSPPLSRHWHLLLT